MTMNLLCRSPILVLALLLGSSGVLAQEPTSAEPLAVIRDTEAPAPLPPGSVTTPPSAPFDYWMLSLSWSPQYCRLKPADQECKGVRGFVEPFGFVAHGLWPQFEVGRPQRCEENPDPVPDELISRMLATMPSAAMIRNQWRRHGTCSGMGQEEYFMFVERAVRRIEIPEAYRQPDDYVDTTLEKVKSDFLAINPELNDASIALQCSGRWLKEIRICYTPDMQPRDCGRDIEDRCRSGKISLRPIRGLPKKRGK